MDEASITVVIPVWDEYVPYLSDAVESVRQDTPDASIVIVDNASSTAVDPPPGASVVRAPSRLSVGAARNLGLDQVTTTYVLVLDADDKLLPGTLDFLRFRLDTDRSIAVSTTSILDSATGKRHRFPRKFVSSLAPRRRTFAFLDCVWSLFPIQSGALMRTEQVQDAGGYADAEWGDDWVLAVSLAFRGRVEVHERFGRYYRHTSKSLWGAGRRNREFVSSARLVRRRLASDPAVPAWARALRPAIAVLQMAAIFLIRPAYLGLRRLRGVHD
jgi:glycosyltransferase involved in cell wall biosynthesis